jgi:hypothetical protein
MMSVLDQIWAEVEPRVYITREQFFDGWRVESQEIDGELAYAALSKGPDYHFMTFGKKHPIPLHLIISQVQPIIDEYGFVRTMTPREDKRQRRFNRLIGFVVEREDEFFTYFRADRLRLHGSD